MSEASSSPRPGSVRTLTMNNPRRLNGWTLPMQAALGEALDAAARDDEVGAVVLTGTGRYYSAGADLSGSIRLGHPRTLRALIVKANYELFDQFVRSPSRSSPPSTAWPSARA
jgi:peroxisomal 3,2-trans-enoyl-CoA isomerase